MDKATRAITVGSLITVAAIGVGVLFWHRIPPKDAFGRTPQSVAEQFVLAVNKKDLELAASYWKQGDIKVFENSYGTNFEAVCTEIIACDSFQLIPRGWQKGGFFVIAFKGDKGGNPRTFGLYLREVGGSWKLAQE